MWSVKTIKKLTVYIGAPLSLVVGTYYLTRQVYVDEIDMLERKLSLNKTEMSQKETHIKSMQDSIRSFQEILVESGSPRLLKRQRVSSAHEIITTHGGYVGWHLLPAFGGSIVSGVNYGPTPSVALAYYNNLDSVREDCLTFHSGDEYQYQVVDRRYKMTVSIPVKPPIVLEWDTADWLEWYGHLDTLLHPVPLPPKSSHWEPHVLIAIWDLGPEE